MPAMPSKPSAASERGKAVAKDPSGAFAVPRFCLEMSEPGARERLMSTEWLLTNGLGGFAMGTAAGVMARRYHALLNAATMPPVGRVSALQATVDTLVIGSGSDERRVDLSTFAFAGGNGAVLHPDGLSRLVRFEKDLTCRWTFRVREHGVDVEVVRELVLIDQLNAAQVRYRVVPAAGATSIRLEIRPLLALRDMHGIIRQSWADAFSVSDVPSGVCVRHPQSPVGVHLIATGAEVRRDAQWWHQFHYAIDAERGQECVEDLFSPGVFTLKVSGTEPGVCVVQAAIEPIAIVDAEVSIRRKRERLAMACASAVKGRSPEAVGGAGDLPTIAALVAAADDFVVKKTTPGESTADAEQTSIIAGYPWFADWGRDTSISLPGLLIATGRLDEASRTLTAFASCRRNGIVPNVFNDQTGRPEFNTVDASLWFILGCCAYFKASGDRASWDGKLLPACLDIVGCYRKGTDFNIAMDPQDKLITAGTNATQLTWMDAKRDGVAFTPRHGKPVEVNALWFAALRELAISTRGDGAVTANLSDLAEAVGKSFRAKFWNAEAGCLFDVLTPNGDGAGWKAIADIRPNQVFAVSVPHSALSIEQQRSVLSVVREKLLTPFGVRTLAPASPGYQPRYEGDMWSRDRAYHNGTAWPWLLGAYAEGVLRVGGFSAAARREAHGVLEPIVREMLGQSTRTAHRGCIGQIAEVYDAEPPQRPQGCTAQAWSVAEVLRVMLMV
ncbi:MAG: amylo-alpha-1,6-glucosidase [Phycisphaerales bacterium]|nr:amylo-alpha-1,6-glucosidase [Phycisphaerales bacterium]